MSLLGEATIRIDESPARVWPLLCDLIRDGDWSRHADPHQVGIEIIAACPEVQLTFHIRSPRALVCSYSLWSVVGGTEVQQTLESPESFTSGRSRPHLVVAGKEELLELNPDCEGALQQLKLRAERPVELLHARPITISDVRHILRQARDEMKRHRQTRRSRQ